VHIRERDTSIVELNLRPIRFCFLGWPWQARSTVAGAPRCADNNGHVQKASAPPYMSHCQSRQRMMNSPADWPGARRKHAEHADYHVENAAGLPTFTSWRPPYLYLQHVGSPWWQCCMQPNLFVPHIIHSQLLLFPHHGPLIVPPHHGYPLPVPSPEVVEALPSTSTSHRLLACLCTLVVWPHRRHP
jgi:hypothetical protein